MMDYGNGQAREHALDVIKHEKSTQHQKLDAILYLMLSDHERIVWMEDAFKSHPFSLIPKQHHGKVWGFFALWFFAVSVTFGERIWFWVQELGIF